jgi:uncharacterized protein YdhG (YjbR/CyaY superfamily)
MSAIDDYLKANATPTQIECLQKIRALAHKMIPKPEEVISYGIPTIKYKGKSVIYFAAFKNHMSVYPITADGIREKLKDFKTSKGTVQFTEAKPVPESIIKEMITLRLKTIDAGSKQY